MYEVFENLLKKHNVTAYKVSKETGIGYSSFSDWKAGRSVPKADKLEKIADYFNITVDQLMGREIEDVSQKKKDFYNELVHELVMSDGETFKIFSAACKEQRLRMALAEPDVANRAGITTKEYVDFESGNEIDHDKVLRIIDVLNIDYAYLYGLIKSKSSYNAEDVAEILFKTDIKESTKQIALYLNKLDPDLLAKIMLETLSYEEIKNYIDLSEYVKQLMDRR